jgi:hypothetical protein
VILAKRCIRLAIVDLVADQVYLKGKRACEPSTGYRESFSELRLGLGGWRGGGLVGAEAVGRNHAQPHD